MQNLRNSVLTRLKTKLRNLDPIKTDDREPQRALEHGNDSRNCLRKTDLPAVWKLMWESWWHSAEVRAAVVETN